MSARGLRLKRQQTAAAGVAPTKAPARRQASRGARSAPVVARPGATRASVRQPAPKPAARPVARPVVKVQRLAPAAKAPRAAVTPKPVAPKPVLPPPTPGARLAGALSKGTTLLGQHEARDLRDAAAHALRTGNKRLASAIYEHLVAGAPQAAPAASAPAVVPAAVQRVAVPRLADHEHAQRLVAQHMTGDVGDMLASTPQRALQAIVAHAGAAGAKFSGGSLEEHARQAIEHLAAVHRGSSREARRAMQAASGASTKSAAPPPAHALQSGEHGGQFYVTGTGRKIYVGARGR